MALFSLSRRPSNFDVILAWRIMYATDVLSHACDPGDAAESLCMSLIMIKGSQARITRPRGSRLGLIPLAISDLS